MDDDDADRAGAISIHSLRVEGDVPGNFSKNAKNYFNPLPPCGGRRPLFSVFRVPDAFQSTPSVWRETVPSPWADCTAQISIHSLRVEGDRTSLRMTLIHLYFNPLPPCGGRLV